MPSYNDAYPMVLNNVYLGVISIRSDQKAYFGIPDATTTELAFLKYRGEIAQHTRKIRSERLDSGTTTREVQVKKVTGISRERGKVIKGRGGKAIKIPTELRNVPAATPTTSPGAPLNRRSTVVYTIIRFPSKASMGEISAWLHEKLKTKKPKSFQSPSGKTYGISPLVTGAIVTGEDTTP